MIAPIDLGIPGLTNIERIGSGGNAVVYRARQPELDRSVVIKVLTNVDAETTRRRFDRERRAMGRLSQTQGIAPLYGSGFTPIGQPYLLMPFYEQGSLQEHLERSGAMGAEQVRDIGVVIAKAVQTAHENGVLHRDIKPANILMSKTGRPDVADFGIARLVDDALGTSQALTMTPLYTAPEVFDGVDSGVSSDVYSLGATLFALLNGYPAYGDPAGGTPVLSLMRRINEDPLPALPPSVPEGLRKVIAKAMYKDPRERHLSAAALASELATAQMAPPAPKLGRSGRAKARRGGTGERSALSPDDRRVSPVSTGRSPLLIAAVVVMLLAGVGGAVFAALRLTGSPDAEPAAASTPEPTAGADQPSRPTPTALAMPSASDPIASVEPAPFETAAAVTAARQALVRVESFSCGGAEITTGILLNDGIVVTTSDVMATPWQIEVSMRGRSVTAKPAAATTVPGVAFVTLEDPDFGEVLNGVSVGVGDTVALVGRDGLAVLATVTEADGGVSNVVVELQEPVGGNAVEPVDVAVTDSGGLVGVVSVSDGRIEVITPAGLQSGTTAVAPVWGCTSTVRGLTDPESAVTPLIGELLAMQELNNAYAAEQWSVVRAIEPEKRTTTDPEFIVGWRPLRQGYVYPVSREIDDAGLASWRIGLIGHETWNGSDLTTLFCLTWKINQATGSITQTFDDAVTIYGSLPGTGQQSGFVDPGDLRVQIQDQCPVAG